MGEVCRLPYIFVYLLLEFAIQAKNLLKVNI